MTVICPKCHYKGVADTPLATSGTGLVCVRCRATMEIPSLNETGTTARPRLTFDSVIDRINAQNQDAPGSPSASDFDADVLEIPDASPINRETSEQAPVLENVFAAASAVATSQEKVLVPQAVVVAEGTKISSERNGHKASPRSWLPKVPTLSGGLLNSRRAPKTGLPKRDKYFLLRISPIVILFGVLVCLSLYSLTDMVTEHDDPTRNTVATNRPAANNQATNQSVASTPAAQNVAAEELDTPVSAATVPAAASSPSISPDQPVAQGDGNFSLQVGSYSEIAKAQEQVGRLKSAGVEARAVAVEIPKRGTWYRVLAGRFKSEEEAEQFGLEMVDEGAVDDFIITGLTTP